MNNLENPTIDFDAMIAASKSAIKPNLESSSRQALPMKLYFQNVSENPGLTDISMSFREYCSFLGSDFQEAVNELIATHNPSEPLFVYDLAAGAGAIVYGNSNSGGIVDAINQQKPELLSSLKVVCVDLEAPRLPIPVRNPRSQDKPTVSAFHLRGDMRMLMSPIPILDEAGNEKNISIVEARPNLVVAVRALKYIPENERLGMISTWYSVLQPGGILAFNTDDSEVFRQALQHITSKNGTVSFAKADSENPLAVVMRKN
jgi:hypothetical protein